MYKGIVVTGWREAGEAHAALIHEHLAALRSSCAADVVLYEGGARGADAIARYWAMKNGVTVRTVRAQWSYYGAQAGAMRNTKMLLQAIRECDGAEHLVALAFPHSSSISTVDCMRKLAHHGVRCVVQPLERVG